MKKMLVSMLLLASTSAFGYLGNNVKTLKGDGKWNDIEGNGGKYKVTVTVNTDADDSATFVETYTFGDKTKTHSFKLVKTSELTFDVMADNDKVGEGYCVDDLRIAHKDCHLAYSQDKHSGEHSASINNVTGEVKRSGSCSEGDKKVVWRDVLRPTI